MVSTDGKQRSLEDLKCYADRGYYIGTPSLTLLPARNYVFKVIKEEHTLTIPRKGFYKDLDPTFFTEEDGEYDILSEQDDGSNILYVPSISKVLFGVKLYPDMTANQIFTPIAIRFNDDSVDIIGQLAELIDLDNETPDEGTIH